MNKSLEFFEILFGYLFGRTKKEIPTCAGQWIGLCCIYLVGFGPIPEWPSLPIIGSIIVFFSVISCGLTGGMGPIPTLACVIVSPPFLLAWAIESLYGWLKKKTQPSVSPNPPPSGPVD